ncbi:hypothetical protein N0V83_007187 [Neocucurbitaria cava]|uniref:Uncharacterized protein n=1 Tax=Neocucurbitaria cava TaxID=798079 RepID=A0A9W9CKK0_9PLEO|nr:hypothetical protein N0V83_007187 [Neocucurbitaria cava]
MRPEPVIAVEPRDAPAATIEMIPCGYVRTSTGAQMSLDESGKQYLVDFRINGDSYTPTFYHISSNCICRFYSGDGGRSGPGMIVEAHGPAEDNFGEKKAVQYKCWIRT